MTAIEHDIVFEPGTRIFSKLEVRFTTEDGKVWHGSATPLGRGWVYKGSGYDNGYNDERGLGFFRGEHAEEADIYDIQHTEDVILPSGETVRPLHREQFSKVIVDGKLGQAHTVVQSTGEHLRYGLGGGAEALPV